MSTYSQGDVRKEDSILRLKVDFLLQTTNAGQASNNLHFRRIPGFLTWTLLSAFAAVPSHLPPPTLPSYWKENLCALLLWIHRLNRVFSRSCQRSLSLTEPIWTMVLRSLGTKSVLPWQVNTAPWQLWGHSHMSQPTRFHLAPPAPESGWGHQKLLIGTFAMNGWTQVTPYLLGLPAHHEKGDGLTKGIFLTLWSGFTKWSITWADTWLPETPGATSWESQFQEKSMQEPCPCSPFHRMGIITPQPAILTSPNSHLKAVKWWLHLQLPLNRRPNNTLGQPLAPKLLHFPTPHSLLKEKMIPNCTLQRRN